MEKERRGKNIVIGILLVTVLCMSAAFAAFTNIPLKVNGVATLPNAQWDVKFTDVDVISTGITTEPSMTNNTLEYTIDLEENTTYEFNATITNSGTYDAEVVTLDYSSIPTALQSLITYTVDGVAEGDTITANGGTDTLHVKVTMGEITDDTLLEAVQDAQSLTLTVLVEYAQASN